MTGTEELLAKREEYTAKAALAGMVYDWFDHSFNKNYRMYDPDTMDLLADGYTDPQYYRELSKRRANTYGFTNTTP